MALSSPLTEVERDAVLMAYGPSVRPQEALRRFEEWVAEGLADFERMLTDHHPTIRQPFDP
jgi:hypothetical protein